MTTLSLIFGRAVADAPDSDGIVTLVMSADDWETACKLLKLENKAQHVEPAPAEEAAAISDAF